MNKKNIAFAMLILLSTFSTNGALRSRVINLQKTLKQPIQKASKPTQPTKGQIKKTSKDLAKEMRKTPKKIKQKILKNPLHAVFWGVYSQKKSPKKTFETLTKHLKDNKYVYKWLINFLHKTKNFFQVRQLLPKIKKMFPELLKKDPGTGFKMAYALLKQVKIQTQKMPKIIYNQIMDILVPLNKKFQSNQQVASLTAMLYDLNNDPRNAIAVAKKYLNSSAAAKPTDFITYFKNAGRYASLSEIHKANKTKSHKKLKKALINIKKSLDLQPRFPNSWLVSASIKEKLGKLDDAIKDCKKAIKITGPNKKMIQVLLSLFFKQKKVQYKKNMFKIESQCFMNALMLFKQKKYNEALEQLNKCLSDQQKGTQQESPQKFLKIHVISTEKNKHECCGTLWNAIS